MKFNVKANEGDEAEGEDIYSMEEPKLLKKGKVTIKIVVYDAEGKIVDVRVLTGNEDMSGVLMGQKNVLDN